MDPQRRIRGLVADPPGRPVPIPTTTNTRTLDNLTTQFPVRRNFEGGWSSLVVTLSNAPAAYANMGAWFNLVSIGPQQIGQEFVLATVSLEMESSDSAGGGGFAAWGNVQGTGGMIVVAKNLPLRRDDPRWQPYPVQSATLNPPVAGVPSQLRNSEAYIADLTLPAGAYVAAPQKVAVSKDYAPFVHRFTYGADQLSAWFVMPGAALAALAGQNIRGLVKCNLEIGMVASARPVGI